MEYFRKETKMEKLTISQAMIKLSDLEKSYHQKMYLLQQIENNTIMYILESDDKKYFCNEPFDFEKVFNEFLDISNKIHEIKSEISKSNNIVELEILGQRMTVQGALNKSRMLRSKRDMIENIVAQARTSRARKVDAAATSAYYNVCEPNFDKIKMQELIENIDKELLEIELEINKSNNESVIIIA